MNSDNGNLNTFPKFTDPDLVGMDGAYSAMFSPFREDGSVVVEAVAPMVEWHLKNGLRGFYVTGSTGEGILMSVEERKTMMKAVADANKGRGKLIAHIGATATRDSIELARCAADLGYDWTSSVAPVFLSRSWDDCYYHFKSIADAAPLPFMIYSRGTAIDPEKDARFFDIPNVKGMKYTGSTYWSVRCLKDKLGKEALFMAGMDEQLLGALAFGDLFSGGIGTTYNYLPRLYSDIVELAKAGRYDEASELQHRSQLIVEFCAKGNTFDYWKAVMRYIGLDCGHTHGPCRPISEAEYLDFAAGLAQFDFLKKAEL